MSKVANALILASVVYGSTVLAETKKPEQPQNEELQVQVEQLALMMGIPVETMKQHTDAILESSDEMVVQAQELLDATKKKKALLEQLLGKEEEKSE